ncbi:MAG TPA: RNase adapter RapZ [Thiothrix sp.]|nr:RNase adapter RapZ [Thiothrix sp.]
MDFVIVSGLSGSGKTMALNTLEDQGYYCIDNLPLELLGSLFLSPSIALREKVAIGVDVRSSKAGLHHLPTDMKTIRNDGHNVTLVYLHADQQILLKRYNETRRKHPLTTDKIGLSEALTLEVELMSEIRFAADLEIDTTYTSIYQLASFLRSRVCDIDQHSLSLMFQSFGFKHGIPASTDFMFDVRCLPNPYWVNEIRQYKGTEKPIINWLEAQNEVIEMKQDIINFTEKWMPSFIANQRSYLTISIGCTGGRHRSVYIAEQLGQYFSSLESDHSANITVFHREIAP